MTLQAKRFLTTLGTVAFRAAFAYVLVAALAPAVVAMLREVARHA